MLAALVVLGRRRGRDRARGAPQRPLRAAAVPAGLAPGDRAGRRACSLLIGGGLALAALEGKPEGTSPVPGATPARLGSIDSNRYQLLGGGGQHVRRAPDRRGSARAASRSSGSRIYERFDASGDAHSLYLETAAELGVVGVAFLLLFLVGIAAAVVRLYRVDPGAATGLAGGPRGLGVPRRPGLGLGDAGRHPARAAAGGRGDRLERTERRARARPAGGDRGSCSCCARRSARNDPMRMTNRALSLLLTARPGRAVRWPRPSAFGQSAGRRPVRRSVPGRGHGQQDSGYGVPGRRQRPRPPTIRRPRRRRRTPATPRARARPRQRGGWRRHPAPHRTCRSAESC